MTFIFKKIRKFMYYFDNKKIIALFLIYILILIALYFLNVNYTQTLLSCIYVTLVFVICLSLSIIVPHWYLAMIITLIGISILQICQTQRREDNDRNLSNIIGGFTIFITLVLTVLTLYIENIELFILGLIALIISVFKLSM